MKYLLNSVLGLRVPTRRAGAFKHIVECKKNVKMAAHPYGTQDMMRFVANRTTSIEISDSTFSILAFRRCSHYRYLNHKKSSRVDPAKCALVDKSCSVAPNFNCYYYFPIDLLTRIQSIIIMNRKKSRKFTSRDSVYFPRKLAKATRNYYTLGKIMFPK